MEINCISVLMHRIQFLIGVSLEISVMLMSRILKILSDLVVLVDREIPIASGNIGILMLTSFFLLCRDLGHQKLLVGFTNAQILSIFLQILLLVHES
jgi:hypothetical protein